MMNVIREMMTKKWSAINHDAYFTRHRNHRGPVFAVCSRVGDWVFTGDGVRMMILERGDGRSDE